MKTVKLDASTPIPTLAAELAAILDRGGLVCLPCGGRYRVVADLTNSDAVMTLMQSKRRVRAAPALVFIAGEGMLPQVTDQADPLVLALGRRFWPLPLTVRVGLGAELPRQVAKQLGAGKARLGVRVPGDPLAQAVVEALGRPLLVSSANRERSAGETSPAQVRKTFLRQVDVFVDKGELSAEQSSTVVEVVDGELQIERAGVITLEMLEAHAPVPLSERARRATG